MSSLSNQTEPKSPLRGENAYAWAGGVFAAEGTIGFGQRKNGRAPVDLRLRMVDRDVLEQWRDVIGVGRIAPLLTPATHTQQWSVVITGQENIVNTLKLLYPYLGARKQAAADEAFAWRKRKNQYE